MKKYILLIVFILSILFTLFSFGFKYLRNRADMSVNNSSAGIDLVVTELVDPGMPDGVVIEDTLESIFTKYISAQFRKPWEEISFSLLQSDGEFSRGVVAIKSMDNEVSILAKMIDQKWVVLHSGEGIAPCNIVDTNNFSESIVPECLNTDGSLRIRLIP